MDILRKLERENVRVYVNVKETGRLLGIGSFGSVVELAIKGAGKFAGKKIHQALAIDRPKSLIIKECKLISELIHPNIAKFCGVCMLPSSPIPVLVVELMDHSLEEIVESTKETLSYKVALSIFIDVAHGLAYLHGRSPSVLHRDLTARNVLLDKSFNAKITDLGNSRIVDAINASKTMTQTPGTLVYMPPEGMQGHSRYGDRFDIFSFGHLGLYTIIRECPRYLLSPTYFNKEGAQSARSEVERRGEYMEKLLSKLPKGHNLYPLIAQCLHNNPPRRPTAMELLHWLQDIQRLELEDFDEPVEYQVHHGAALQVTDQRERMSLLLRDRKLNIDSRREEVSEVSESCSTVITMQYSGGLIFTRLCLRWILREHCTGEAANGHDYHHYSFSRRSGCQLIATALLLVSSASPLLYLRFLQCTYTQRGQDSAVHIQ